MDNYVTSHTLLARVLQEQDQGSWEQFFARYKRYVICLLSKLGIPRDELDDVTQEVMLTLWRRLETYEKSRGKFRSWLAGVVRNSAMNARRKLAILKRISPEELDVNDEAIIDDKSYMQTAEREWKVFIMETALDNIRSEFSAKSIQVFEMTMEGLAGEEIAKELELTLGSVYTLRKRVKKLLMQEVYYLQKDLNHE